MRAEVARLTMRLALGVMAVLLLFPANSRAEWQLKPFVGVTFGGGTTFIDPDQVAGSRKYVFGITGVLFGEIFGVEADIGQTPGFLSGGHNVADSSVTTVTGNIVVAAPRRMTKYTLRPYAVVGGGAMRVHANDLLIAFQLAKTLATVDVGGGATGFFTSRIGITWDVRYFRSVGGKDEGVGLSIGPEQLSFWRATVALTIRP